MEEAPPVQPPPTGRNTTPHPPSAASPVMDVKAPPAKTPAETTPPSLSVKPDAKTKPPAAPKKSKPPKQGVGTAIFATVIVVLGLGVLAVIAYLKSR